MNQESSRIKLMRNLLPRIESILDRLSYREKTHTNEQNDVQIQRQTKGFVADG